MYPPFPIKVENRMPNTNEEMEKMIVADCKGIRKPNPIKEPDITLLKNRKGKDNAKNRKIKSPSA